METGSMLRRRAVEQNLPAPSEAQTTSRSSVNVFELITWQQLESWQKDNHEGAKIRVTFFIGLGVFVCVPVAHGAFVYGLGALSEVVALKLGVVTGLMHLTGALLFGFRIPERWMPGRLDLLGNSHQIMHVFVLVANFVWSIGAVKALEYWENLRASGLACS
ncbi:MAG: hypothetical protein Q9159_005794 [Coniocarpon cinnabarinum]